MTSPRVAVGVLQTRWPGVGAGFLQAFPLASPCSEGEVRQIDPLGSLGFSPSAATETALSLSHGPRDLRAKFCSQRLREPPALRSQNLTVGIQEDNNKCAITRLPGIYGAFGDFIFQFGSSEPHPRGCRDLEQDSSLPVWRVPGPPGEPPPCSEAGNPH